VVEKEEVTAGGRITIGKVTLVPVVRTVARCRKAGRGIMGFGTKEVLGVVVISPSGRRALNVAGEEVPVESLTGKAPEAAGLLNDLAA